MKKLLFLVILTILSTLLNAQDVLTFTSGKVLNVRVIEVSGSEVKFRMYDDLTGPIYVEKLPNIYYIRYQNGEMQIFNNNPERTNRYFPYPIVNAPKRTTSFTTQVDLFVQNRWGVGLVLRKEINPYFGWNLIQASYMSGWNKTNTPDINGLINVRLSGIRLYTPTYDNIRAYADVNLGYSHEYIKFNQNKENFHYFGLDFSTGIELGKHFAVGYNLTFLTNSNGSAKVHWGKLSILF
jgi:hypothetical protein